MGKTSKVLINLDNEKSGQSILQRRIKRKKRKKDLDDLRQQVVKNKHAMRKNSNQVKARKTTFGKTLAEFAERRQAIDDNTQSNGKVNKTGQKKICSKLLADPFIGIFKNGAKGNEVSRKQEFLNETDKARVSGDVFKLLQGDDSMANKVAKGSRGKTTQTTPKNRKVSKNVKKSPVLVKSPQNKRKASLIHGTKAGKSDKKSDLNGILMRFNSSSTEKLEEVSDEDLLVNLLKENREKFRNQTAEVPRNLKSRTGDEDFKYWRDKLVRRNNENCESKSSSFNNHESLSREMCKQMCNAVSQQLAPENCFMSTKRDPLKTTKQSLKCLYSDSHRQDLLRNKVECSGNGNLSTSDIVESIETPRILNHLEEKTQPKNTTKKTIFTTVTGSPKAKLECTKNRKKMYPKEKEPSAVASSSTISFISEITEKSFNSRKDKQALGNNFLSWEDDIMKARQFPKNYEITMQNTFKNAFRENPQISPLNLSRTNSEIKDIEMSLFDGETRELDNWIRHPTTPTKKEVSRDDHSHVFKSKANFLAAKGRQTKPVVACSSPDKFFITGKAEEKKKHVVNVENLFELTPPYEFSRDCQETVEHQNSMLQQRKNFSDFKSQMRRDDQQRQEKNTQIHQQSSECPVLFLQSGPKSYPGIFKDVKRHRNIQLYENSQRPLNSLPSFYPSQLQNLTSSYMEPEKTLITKQESDLKIRDGIEILNLLPHILSPPGDFYERNRDIGRISSSNTQTDHLTSQPIKYIAMESDQQVQRRVPVYFHEKKPCIAYLPSSEHESSCKVMQSQPRVLSCMQCANSASVFCHQNISTLPPVAHQNSFRPSSQGYHVEKAGNSTVPEVRFIKTNNAQHGVKVLGFDDCRLAHMFIKG